MIYFVQCGCGPIKIGRSKNVAGRLASMQSNCPFELVLLATASDWDQHEAAIHNALAFSRVRDEWFHPSEPLVELVRAARAGEALPSFVVQGDQRSLHRSAASARGHVARRKSLEALA